MIRSKLCLLGVLLNLAVPCQMSESCNKLHAVVNFHDVTYFVLGHHHVIGYNSNGERVFHGDTTEVGFAEDITAGYAIPEIDRFVLIAGKKEQGIVRMGQLETLEPLSWVLGDDKLESADPNYNGIDAAVLRGDYDAYYFAGCQYLVVSFRQFKVTEQDTMAHLHLPCDVDAAWASSDRQTTIIAKGHDLYIWPVGQSQINAEVRQLYDIYPQLAAFNICG